MTPRLLTTSQYVTAMYAGSNEDAESQGFIPRHEYEIEDYDDCEYLAFTSGEDSFTVDGISTVSDLLSSEDWIVRVNNFEFVGVSSTPTKEN